MAVFGGDGEAYFSTPGGIVRVEAGHSIKPAQGLAITLNSVKTIAIILISNSNASVLQQALLKSKVEKLLLLYSQYLDAITENNSEQIEVLSRKKLEKIQEIGKILGEINSKVRDELIETFTRVENIFLQVGKGDQPYK